MIIFNIATVQRRKSMFLEVLAMLKNQTVPCDKINVAMSYKEFDPDIVNYLKKNFTAYHIKWKFGMTAEYKMFAMQSDEIKNNFGDYFLTFDDDIIYPSDYCERVIAGINKYERRAVVGFHGITFDKFPVLQYKAQKTMHQYFKKVDSDLDVHVIGTGCLGFYTDLLIGNGFDFPTINKKMNCLDGAFGRWCRDTLTRMVVLSHEADWMKVYPDSQDMQSLWKRSWAERYKTKLSYLQQ